MTEIIEGIRGRIDRVSQLHLGDVINRHAYQHMLAQLGGIVHRPFYAHQQLSVGSIKINLSENRLLDLFESKSKDIYLYDNAGYSYRYSGEAAKDGTESYQLKKVHLLFEEYSRMPNAREPSPRPMNFMMYLDIEIGDAIEDTFVQSSSSLVGAVRYWASIQVVWGSIWKFFPAPTNKFAEAFRDRVVEFQGFDVGPPPYTVR